MNPVLQKLSIFRLAAAEWVRQSLVWKSFNPLRQWRQHSILMQWSTGWAGLLIAILLAIAPFVPTSYIGIVEIGCGGLWFLSTLSEDAPQPQRFSPVQALVMLYWGTAAIATLLSPVRTAALSGFIELTLYLLVFALIERTVRLPRWRNGLIAVYLLVSFWVTLYGLRQWFFGAEALATWVDPTSPSADMTRVYSYLGNPNLLAAYLVPAVALSLAAIFGWRQWGAKLLAACMFGANSICLVLTFSRGGWLAILATIAVAGLLLLYWVLPHLPRFWRRWSFPILLLGGLAVTVGAILFVPPVRDRALSIFSSRADSSNNFRINVWEAVFEMICDRPLIGIGPGHDAFNKIYPLYQQPKFSALSAYSIYLEHLVEFGILGFTTFIALLLSLGYQGWQGLVRLREQQSSQGLWMIAALSGMAGLLVQGAVDTVWYRPQVFILWWLMVAIVASFYGSVATNPKQA